DGARATAAVNRVRLTRKSATRFNMVRTSRRVGNAAGPNATSGTLPIHFICPVPNGDRGARQTAATPGVSGSNHPDELGREMPHPDRCGRGGQGKGATAGFASGPAVA